jgi:hypothetical protein
LIIDDLTAVNYKGPKKLQKILKTKSGQSKAYNQSDMHSSQQPTSSKLGWYRQWPVNKQEGQITNKMA